jgi:hypothetical protein
MFPVLVPIVLLANGLAAGVLLWSVIGGVPMLRWLPAARYVETEQFWGNRFEPFQPICVVVTAVGDIALAIIAGLPAGPLFGTAGMLAVKVLLVSLTRNVPIKRWVMSLDPGSLPADWEQRDPRARWAKWNLIRSSLAVAAFVLNLVAVATTLH